MSDLLERIKKIGYCHNFQLERPDLVYWINQMNDVVKFALEVSAKEPNIPVQCVDGSCPIALSDEYEERGIDVTHSCDECQYNKRI